MRIDGGLCASDGQAASGPHWEGENMATVIGVRFKKAGKVYYFDPNDIWPLSLIHI